MFDFNYVKKKFQELEEYLENNDVWVLIPFEVEDRLDYSAVRLSLYSNGLVLGGTEIPMHEIVCDPDFEGYHYDFIKQEDFVYIFSTKEKAKEVCDRYNKGMNERRKKEQRAEDKICEMTDEELDKFLEE